MKQTLRTILVITLVATLLFSAAYALDSTEQDFLSFFFDERQVDALQDYQKKYTANEFLALKIQGKLPALPTAKPAPEPVVIPAPETAEIGQPSIEDEQFIEEDKTVAAAVVFDSK